MVEAVYDSGVTQKELWLSRNEKYSSSYLWIKKLLHKSRSHHKPFDAVCAELVCKVESFLKQGFIRDIPLRPHLEDEEIFQACGGHYFMYDHFLCSVQLCFVVAVRVRFKCFLTLLWTASISKRKQSGQQVSPWLQLSWSQVHSFWVRGVYMKTVSISLPLFQWAKMTLHCYSFTPTGNETIKQYYCRKVDLWSSHKVWWCAGIATEKELFGMVSEKGNSICASLWSFGLLWVFKQHRLSRKFCQRLISSASNWFVPQHQKSGMQNTDKHGFCWPGECMYGHI